MTAMRLVTFGELNLHVTVLPGSGEPDAGPTVDVAVGGPPAFAARQARALGARASVVAVAGDDPLGWSLPALLAVDSRSAPESVRVVPSGDRTGRLLLYPDPNGEARIEVDPSDCSLDDLTGYAEEARGADFVHLAYFPGTGRLHTALAELGVPRLVDVGFLPWRHDRHTLAAVVDSVPMGAEVLILNGAGDRAGVEQVAADAVRLGRARLALVTLGADGAALVDGKGIRYQPAHPSRPVCTVGAGDSLAVAFALAVHRGEAPDDALAWAQLVAARKVEQLSAPAYPPIGSDL